MGEVQVYIVTVQGNGQEVLEPLVPSPGELTFRRKLNAGSTFDFKYPNPYGMVRSKFQENRTLVRAVFQGTGTFLEGIVREISNDPISTVSCADIISIAGDVRISTDEIRDLVGLEMGRALSTLFAKAVGGRFPLKERIGGTDPVILFEEEHVPATDIDSTIATLVTSILGVINETVKEKGLEEEYVFGVINGFLRMEKQLLLGDQEPTLTLFKESNLYEEVPEFHFDRLVNSARYVGTLAESTVVGERYRDEHSINIYGLRESRESLSTETTDPIELYELARDLVERSKALTYTTRIQVPKGFHLMPGFHTVDIRSSEYGIRGRSRIIQVEGSSGTTGTVKVSLNTVPLDDVEVLRQVLGLS